MSLNSITVILPCILLLLLSCESLTERKHEHPEDALIIKINTKPGKIMSGNVNSTLPTFFSLAELEDHKGDSPPIILLNEGESQKKKITASPVALFSFLKDSTLHKFIIAVPYDTTSTYDFQHFMLEQPHLHQALEEWFRTDCELGQCRDFKWENEYKALLEISNTSER